MCVVTALGVGHPIAMAEGYGALAQAFEHHDIELAAFDQIDRRIEPVGGKSRAGTDAKRRRGHPQSPFSGPRSGKNKSSIDAGACLIEPIFAMNCAVANTLSG